MLRYLSPVGGGLAAASLATAGAHFVAAVTSGHPQPWWPYVLLFGLIALGGLLYLIGQRHPRTGRSESTTAATATGKDDTPAATTTRPAPAAAEDGIPATAETPSHPAGMGDESDRRTREPGKPTVGAGRPPGLEYVLTASQHGRSGPGPGSDGARRILKIALACAILAAAAVVSVVLARSSPTYQGGGIWVHPAAAVAHWGDGPMVIAVQVTNISQVEHINFTGTWPGVGWKILPGCAETVAPPYPAGDIYRCTFDPRAAGVPARTNMTLSFDVYGTPANAPPFNLSPNGAHQVSWGWRCIYNPPASTCLGW